MQQFVDKVPVKIAVSVYVLGIPYKFALCVNAIKQGLFNLCKLSRLSEASFTAIMPQPSPFHYIICKQNDYATGEIALMDTHH